MKHRFSLFKALLIALLCLHSNLNYAAPVSELDTDEKMLKFQFVLLVSTNPQDLNTEAWNSTSNTRAQALKAIEKLNSNQDTTFVQKPQELLSKLGRLTQSGQFEVMYATQWSQPSSQSRSSINIATDVNEIHPFNLLYGQIKIFERSALIAKLKVHLVDTNSLKESLDEVQSNNVINTELSMLTTNINGDIKSSQHTPILFLDQQQQIKLNKIIYFDHPVTPGFLLITPSNS